MTYYLWFISQCFCNLESNSILTVNGLTGSVLDEIARKYDDMFDWANIDI